ncbi:peptidase family C54-domain-containing protein [Mycena leptocephala]|nr:peptidase family C54-domain-containing protein [Mycena leptocephala]
MLLQRCPPSALSLLSSPSNRHSTQHPPRHPRRARSTRLLSWFLAAPVASFGVHRMALAGKAAGKDAGMWFAPSAAAEALRTLVAAFPAASLGVSVAADGTLYQTEVFAASHSPIAASSESSAASVSSHGSHGRGSSSGHSKGGGKGAREKVWGDRPVLLLLGIRLGLDGLGAEKPNEPESRTSTS